MNLVFDTCIWTLLLCFWVSVHHSHLSYYFFHGEGDFFPSLLRSQLKWKCVSSCSEDLLFHDIFHIFFVNFVAFLICSQLFLKPWFAMHNWMIGEFKWPQIFAWTFTRSLKTFSSAYFQDHCYPPGCMHLIKHGKMNFLSVILNWAWAQIHVPLSRFRRLFQPILPQLSRYFLACCDLFECYRPKGRSFIPLIPHTYTLKSVNIMVFIIYT